MSLYVKALDRGSPGKRLRAHLLVSAALALVVAVPAFAVAARLIG